MEEARDNGVALVSATEPLDFTSPIGDAMVKVLAVFAELERKTIAFRVTSAIAHLRSTGRITGGPIPYGMRKAPNQEGAGYVLTVDEETAVYVLEMVDSVLAGESYRSVCRRMNERQIPTPRGRSSMWRPNTIRAILRNPALWGAVVHQGQVVRGDDGMPLLGAAIISRDTWDEVQTEMARRGKPSERNGSLRQGLLSSLLICDHCGANLGVNRGGTRTRERMYMCPTKGHGGSCPGVAVTADRIEEYVSDRFLEKYGTWTMPLPVFFEDDEATSAKQGTDELRAVETALADLEADRYERGLFGGESGARRFAEMYQRLEARRDVLMAEARVAGPQTAEDSFEILPTTMGEYWATAGQEEKRLLLRGLVGSIRVKKGVPGRKGLDPARVTFEKGLT
jgi:site-specific DNA recombinase